MEDLAKIPRIDGVRATIHPVLRASVEEPVWEGLQQWKADSAFHCARHHCRSMGLNPISGVHFPFAPTDSGAMLALTLAFAGACSRDAVYWAEVRADGTLARARGTLAVLTAAAQDPTIKTVVIAEEARSLVMPHITRFGDLQIYVARDLNDVLTGNTRLDETSQFWPGPVPGSHTTSSTLDDLANPAVRRAIVASVAGGHGLLLRGPVGGGKTRAARVLASLLPSLTADQELEVDTIYDVCRTRARSYPPVRWPHHTVSAPGMAGGGRPTRIGELTLARHGVLVLDEASEFMRSCIRDCAHAALEGSATIVTSAEAVEVPTTQHLVVLARTCPCGFHGHPDRVCVDSGSAVARYQARIQPLLRVLDLRVLTHEPSSVHCTTIVDPAEAIRLARAAQAKRGALNAVIAPAKIRLRNGAAREVEGLAPDHLERAVRVARTLADMEGLTRVQLNHVREAREFTRAVD
jgi:predicted ATPase with chaperone activity